MSGVRLDGPYLNDPDFTLWLGDALALTKQLPSQSVNCCITSPPYWGLRDYEADGQLGREETPEEYVAHLVALFADVGRVLRDDGTLWLNLGDSYASDSKGGGGMGKSTLGSASGGNAISEAGIKRSQERQQAPSRRFKPGVKAKNLVGIPWRVAFALQADGWYLRSDIIWHKPNPMPSSATDRPTLSHEYLFLLTRSPRYYYDADAIREEAKWERWGDQTTGEGSMGWISPGKKRELVKRRTVREGVDTNGGGQGNGAITLTEGQGKNKRSVWTIPTESNPDPHYATFPQALVEPCILAGCPPNGTIFDPFIGSGTTALVARRLGRRCIGIEISEASAKIAARRTQQLSVLA